MSHFPAHIQPDRWLIQLFSSKAAATGGVVRRQFSDIETVVGWERFEHEIRRRGYHCFANAGQVIVICNQDPVHVVC